MPLDPQSLHASLRRAARRCRWSRSARCAISGMAASLLFLMLFLLCDAQFHFGAAGRWSAFILTILPLLAGFVAAAWAARPAISESSIARRIEAASAGSGNVLISAVQFDRELAVDSPLRGALFSEMRDPFPEVDWSEVFDLKLLKKLALALAVAGLGIGLWAAIKPMYFANSAARIFLPASGIAPLTRTRFAGLEPGDAQVVHGKDVTITARLEGEIPRAAWFHSRESGGAWQSALMDREVGAAVFTCQARELNDGIEYYVEAGDAQSETHRLTVRPRTAIRQRTATITPPAYTRLGPIQVKDFTSLQAVTPGSRVTVTMDFNNPVPQLDAADEKDQPITTKKLAGAGWELTETVMAGHTVKLDYRDAAGVSETESWPVTIKADEPPTITVTEPAEGTQLFASPDASVRIAFSAQDDFGLASVRLHRSTGKAQDAELVQDFSDAAGRKSMTAQAFVPLSKYTGQDQVTFCLVAKDANNVTGPGVTMSRPIVVTLRSAEQVRQQIEDTSSKVQQGVEELITLQKTNLDGTRAADKTTAVEVMAGLLNRQLGIQELANTLTAAQSLMPGVCGELSVLAANEMPAAVLALRNAGGATGADRTKWLSQAVVLEAAILARLRGAPAAAAGDAERGRILDLISSVEDLLRKQREIWRETQQGAKDGDLSGRQDALADEAQHTRKTLDESAQNATLGDPDFRARLAKASAMFGDLKIYEGMLEAADRLESKNFPAATATQTQVVSSLAKIADLLNQWQLANAAREADALRNAAQKIADNLGKLAAIQRDIVEKSEEQARKNDARAEDASTSKEVKLSQDLMGKVIEQMLTDAHIFPDLKPSNQLRSELTSIYEDVIQADKQDAAEGKLKPQEIAVQKEDGILQAIEQAQKISEDMEMWLPNKNETAKWELENFDKTEIPQIPNLPLPDAFEDIVGKLLDEQQNIADKVQDAASNQAFAQNAANGWEIRDGPMPGFGAQGKSGNERPNKNEQTGRSSGGREGMSDGEMVGDTASNLEGTKPDVRRTNDPMQQGQVRDNGGIASTRATGGGKAAGFSDRLGMDGNAPLRPSNAASMPASDALAVQQALLAEKTSKTAAQASLLYLRTSGMTDVAQLMEESQIALKEGRTQDFASIHQKIMARLTEVKNGIGAGNAAAIPGGEAAQEQKQLLGGDEGEAPAQYKEAVADYYRSLVEGR